MSKSVEFWYFRISRNAFTPGRKRFFFPFEMVLSMLTGWGAFFRKQMVLLLLLQRTLFEP